MNSVERLDALLTSLGRFELAFEGRLKHDAEIVLNYRNLMNELRIIRLGQNNPEPLTVEPIDRGVRR